MGSGCWSLVSWVLGPGFLEGDLKKPLQLVNESIRENPKIEIAYLVKRFLFHKKGEFDKAIKDCNVLARISINEQMIQAAELWTINLEQEKKKHRIQ